MLSPQVARQLNQIVTFYRKGFFTEQEFSGHLTSLVSRENAADMLDGLPAEMVPSLKEAVVNAAQDSVDSDCLRPEESVFQERTVSASYYPRVAELLLKQSASRPRPSVTVVGLPSFEVEWALHVRGSAKIGFTAILTEPKERIWCHVNPQSITVRIKQREVDIILGKALCEIWENVLQRTRHPRRASLGLDGVSYHFAYSGVEMGNMAGQTWSPDRSTLPGKLVAVSHALRAYVEAGDEVVEKARKDLDGCIDEFNGLT